METAGEKMNRPAERELYKQLWATEQYRAVAPGEHCVHEFLQQARPPLGSTVIDFGCGTGRGGLLLAFPVPVGANMKVTLVDFADNCLDPEIKDMLKTQAHVLSFLQHDLTEPLSITANYGYCTDVMEHIPSQDVNKVLNNILMAAQHCFFQISTVDDVLGGLVGHPLHLTVRPYEWWLQKFKDRECVVHWSKETNGACMFYVSAWASGKDITESGTLNVADEVAKEHVRFNVSQGWMQVEPHAVSTDECLILGGSPSLNDFEDEIIRRRVRDGAKLITMNGSYHWALARNLTPSAQVVVDARPHNARFTKPVVDDCRYLIGSQVDPSVLEGLPKDRTYLWHTGAQQHKEILDLAYDSRWWWVPGGSTVLLRTIPLMRLLGYKRFHLYGCDSCYQGDRHHAYAQAENDNELPLATTLQVNGKPLERVFMTTVWQASQASEFIDLIRFLGDEIELQVHGDGLLAYILRTGAEISTETEGE